VVRVNGDNDEPVVVEVVSMKKRSVIDIYGCRIPSCGYRPINVP
jgi:hypothetical protein